MRNSRQTSREIAYRKRISRALLAAVVIHAMIAGLTRWVRPSEADDLQSTTDSGLKGPTRSLEELQIIEPNSVQAHFFQRRREGRASLPEFVIVEPIREAPGPQPVRVQERKIRQPVREKTFDVFDDEFELVEPVRPTHREVSFSEHFYALVLVEPEYPEYEVHHSITGNVLVEFFVEPSGYVSEARVLESQSLPPGSSTRAFELSSLEAIRRWQFSAKTETGKQAGERMLYTVIFHQDP